MKLLRKILLIVMICVFAGNADVRGMHGVPPPPPLPAALPVLDFNNIAVGNVPSCFVPRIYRQAVPPPPGHMAAVNMPNVDCVYFAIPQNGAVVNLVFANPVNPVVPANTDYNIYFPADGSQPTTPEAVQYSCANIDNREDSPITDWYMKMFGVIPFQNTGVLANDYIKAGWNDTSTAEQQIVRFNLGQYIFNLSRVLHDFLQHCPDPTNLNASNLKNLTIDEVNAIINAVTAQHIRQLVQDIENARIGIKASITNGGETPENADKFILEVKNKLNFLREQMDSIAPNSPAQQFIGLLEGFFVKHFRKIASTYTGRMLLYRILIEIRRHQAGNNNGCTGVDIIALEVLTVSEKNILFEKRKKCVL